MRRRALLRTLLLVCNTTAEGLRLPVHGPLRPCHPCTSRLQPSHLGCRRCSSPRLQGDYDLGRKEFDLLELQEFRRETILQYSLINRTEQLRIILLALSALISAFAPSIAAELFPSPSGQDPGLDFGAIGISAASTLAFGGLTYREKVARGQKLRRLEREFSAGELSVTQPATPLAGARTVQLTALRDRRRVVAITASSSVLDDFLSTAAVYRRRLALSGIVVVTVPTDGEGGEGGGAAAREAEEAGWLWRPSQPAAWSAYFSSLLEARGGAAAGRRRSLPWWRTPPRLPALWLPRPLLRTPERRISRSEAPRPLGSSRRPQDLASAQSQDENVPSPSRGAAAGGRVAGAEPQGPLGGERRGA